MEDVLTDGESSGQKLLRELLYRTKSRYKLLSRSAARCGRASNLLLFRPTSKSNSRSDTRYLLVGVQV